MLCHKCHKEIEDVCPFQHKDFSNGLNIYLSEQYEISSTSTVNVYYWFLYNKQHTQCILFTVKDTNSHHLNLFSF
jgi:hypothetical protein